MFRQRIQASTTFVLFLYATMLMIASCGTKQQEPRSNLLKCPSEWTEEMSTQLQWTPVP